MASYDRGTSEPAGGAEGALTAGRDVLLLIGRVALGVLFLQSGFGKLTSLAGFAAGLEGMGVPMAYPMALIGAAVEFLGGLALVVGAWTWLSSLALVAFTVVATLLAHRYWAVPPEQQGMQQIQFMKNLAVIGGLLVLAVAGPGRYAIDAMLRRRP